MYVKNPSLWFLRCAESYCFDANLRSGRGERKERETDFYKGQLHWLYFIHSVDRY